MLEGNTQGLMCASLYTKISSCYITFSNSLWPAPVVWNGLQRFFFLLCTTEEIMATFQEVEEQGLSVHWLFLLPENEHVASFCHWAFLRMWQPCLHYVFVSNYQSRSWNNGLNRCTLIQLMYHSVWTPIWIFYINDLLLLILWPIDFWKILNNLVTLFLHLVID